MTYCLPHTGFQAGQLHVSLRDFGWTFAQSDSLFTDKKRTSIRPPKHPQETPGATSNKSVLLCLHNRVSSRIGINSASSDQTHACISVKSYIILNWLSYLPLNLINIWTFNSFFPEQTNSEKHRCNYWLISLLNFHASLHETQEAKEREETW